MQNKIFWINPDPIYNKMIPTDSFNQGRKNR